jgi:transcriptional regulator with XRE-family HTH domain
MRSRLTSRSGLSIRRLRLARGMTLAELSERSGVPLSSLSKLELGQLSLSYDKLTRLSRALGADFDQIVMTEVQSTTPTGRRSVARAGDGQRVMWGPHRTLVAASDLLSKAFTPVMLEVKVHSLRDHGPFTQLSGEAYLMALDGELILHVESYAPLTLSPGDGIYFDGRSPHAILAGGGGTARALLIASADDSAFT